ncbi:glycogen debranching protein [Dickeya zeae]|uniref:glycogen debranching protein n=1 Tax=Dickeya zeae TaxID=204042 RepID=UPI001CFAED76|nr:glycogen debranching protein [Dickeya zeae]UCZ77112.1 glycogen debranching protein [Dickeya zeae]
MNSNNISVSPSEWVLKPQSDGQLLSTAAPLLPFMARRVQGSFSGEEGIVQLALWGSGTLGRLHVAPFSGPCTFAPNRLLSETQGFYVAQSQPVVLLTQTSFLRFYPAKRRAWWDQQAGRALREKQGTQQRWVLPWGVVIVEQRDNDVLIAAGNDDAEALRGLLLSTEQIRLEAQRYIDDCDQLPQAQPLLRSMVQQSLHAALSSIRYDHTGKFAGLAAGMDYSAPARTYYRDGYWTLQALLPLQPQIVLEEIHLMAAGLQPTGEAPSGVILNGPGLSAAWEDARRHNPAVKENHSRPQDWWSDHFDSPLFFILTIADYVRVTGDASPREQYWAQIATIITRYEGFILHEDGLPQKPSHNDRDWADNVYRFGYVAYDLGLWFGAVNAVAQWATERDPALAQRCARLASQASRHLDAALLQPDGHYADYGRPGEFIEDHLTLDSLTLLRYGAVDAGRAEAVLRRVQARLESRHNSEQRYGDWGVLCAWPPFKRRSDTRAKSAFALRYHNGSDWPYLDGLYADTLLQYGIPGSEYPLTRWWMTCLEQGWAGAVEYFSPPFGRGSLLQGWSSMPAAVVMKYRHHFDGGQ